MPRARGEDNEVTRDQSSDTGLCCMLFVGDRSSLVQLPLTGSVIIGRGSQSDLNVSAEGVSRKHVRLEVHRERAVVHDLGSRNGTYVNGEPVRAPRTVEHGDEIRVGEARLILSRRRASAASAPALLLHGAFVARLRIEFARSLGFGRPISIVVVELPARWFEVDLGPVLSAALRPVDVCGLYDDAVLEIMLPEANAEDARRVETSLLEALRARELACFGGSATTARGGSAEELLDRALNALRVATGADAPPEHDEAAPIIADPVMVHIYEQIRRVAPSNINVLVIGETGVGKEVIAHAIHAESRRKGKLVCVNAAALPETLLESELFGHERGAFTGATQAKQGLFEAANGGTLFLDEIGELPLTMQAKLLRVLEDQTVRRIGSTVDRKIEVRVVAATNSDLGRRADERTFRRDLLFRLNACTFVIPPLRDRAREIGQLAEHFLARAASTNGRRLRLSPEVVRLLEAYAWPGNVRELRNVIERAVALCEGTGGLIEPQHLPDTIRFPPPPEVAIPDPGPVGTLDDVRTSTREHEKKRILEALARADGNQTRAAELLGLPRRTLSYRMERLGIVARPSPSPRRGSG